MGARQQDLARVEENAGQHHQEKPNKLHFLDESINPRALKGESTKDPCRHLLSLGLPREMGHSHHPMTCAKPSLPVKLNRFKT